MGKRTFFAAERKIQIVDYINDNKKATVKELSKIFNVSPSTIRGDLRDLEKENQIVKAHGGALVKTKTSFETNLETRRHLNLEAKNKIGKTALNLIEDGDTIILDTGSTTIELAKLLSSKKDISVLTNDLKIALLLDNYPHFNIFLLGGSLRRNYHCTNISGFSDNSVFANLTVDKAFIGTNGFSYTKGATTPDFLQAETKKFMISLSHNIIILCDSSKIGKDFFIPFAPLKNINILITDSIYDKYKKEIEKRGVSVLVAD